jgi:hypothetical protein
VSHPALAPARAALPLAALAALYAGLNACKPLQIDDTAYSYYARQLGSRPLDPYGFAVYWYDEPEPANEVLAPPVFPAYCALLRRAAGERPWLWKLGLLPWAALLVFAFARLARRFCTGLELPLTALVVLSPALLPAFNLMLDVPALALALAALDQFFRAVERGSLGRSAWAGLLAGLAMQTKYTAVTAPGAMLLYALLGGRPRLWAVAVLVAAQVFLAWEWLTALLYGDSHFLAALGGGMPLADKLGNLPFLATYLGGLAPAGVLLALAALGLSRVWLALAAGLFAAGYALIALLDVRFVSQTALSPLVFGPLPAPEPVEFQLAELVFYAFALAGAVALVLVCRRLLAAEWARSAPRPPGERGWGEGTFLVLWLALEVAGYVALTPFPAARRVLGVGVVLALLTGRLAAHACRLPPPAGAARRRTVWAIAAGGALLGLAFFALDWRGAAVHQQAAEGAARLVREQENTPGAGGGGGTVWFVGHWGFQYYAERAGMRPVVTRAPGYPPRGGRIPLPPPSRLRRGDWLVVPDPRLNQQALRLEEGKLRLAGEVVIPARLPLRATPCFSGGRTPLEHHEGTRLEVRVYRVLEDFTPSRGRVPAFHSGH